MDGQAGFAIELVTRIRSCCPARRRESVLGAEQSSQFDVRVFVDQVRRVTIGVIDGGLVADQSNARASNGGMAFFK
jgi:hypothetical protein